MRIGLVFALALAGCTTSDGPTPRQQANQWALANATPVGEPVNCIDTRRIRNMRARDDRNIDFEMTGRQVMRNTLPQACPGMTFDNRFAHRSTTGRLCSIDTVTVLRSDGSRGVTCGLGSFQQVEIAPRP